MWVKEPVTSGEVLGFYLLPFPPGHLVLGCLSGLPSRVKPGVAGTALAPCQTEHAQLRSGFGPGLGSRRAAAAAESECAQLRGRSRSPARGRRAARLLLPVLQPLATGGGEQTSTCCWSRHHLSTLSTTRKCGTHTRSEKLSMQEVWGELGD